MKIPSGVAASAILSLALAIALATPAVGKSERRPKGTKTWTSNFAADTLGLLPANSRAFGGNWWVVVDSSRAAADSTLPADSLRLAPRCIRQSESDDGLRFHYIQFLKPVLENMDASVRFRIISGEIDPTAGLLIQLDRKGTSGYIVRVSGETGELIVHYLLYGKRRDLKFAEIDPPQPGTWHTLSVEHKGSVLTARYDGVEKIKIRDERYFGGGVGLWTEDDTVVEFADLAVSTR